MEKELLNRFFGGSATVEEEKQVLDWIDADPAHRAQMLRERRLFDAMLLHARPAASKRARLTLPLWARETMKYAAAALLVVLVGVNYVTRRDNKLLEAVNTITVPAGQRVDIVLPDGTKVCMNALSELRYPTFFVGKSRKVQLSGEAFFDVAHDKSHPFIVETHTCDIEVLGTRFDVESRSVADGLLVSLVEGRVKVTDRNNRSRDVVLQSNERLSYRGERFEVGQIPEGEDFLWRDGLIAFRDATFEELLEMFEKYYGVTIELQSRDLPTTVFTGKIRIAEGIDHALRVLRRSANFTYTRNDATNVVYIK